MQAVFTYSMIAAALSILKPDLCFDRHGMPRALGSRPHDTYAPFWLIALVGALAMPTR